LSETPQDWQQAALVGLSRTVSTTRKITGDDRMCRGRPGTAAKSARRGAGSIVVGPLAGDEVTMPAQNRGRGDREDLRPPAAVHQRDNAVSQIRSACSQPARTRQHGRRPCRARNPGFGYATCEYSTIRPPRIFRRVIRACWKSIKRGRSSRRSRAVAPACGSRRVPAVVHSDGSGRSTFAGLRFRASARGWSVSRRTSASVRGTVTGIP
jgi:hypothetical protein